MEGHTANISENPNTESSSTRFSWDLSYNRSYAVLDYFSGNTVIPQAKMSVAGFSHFRPIGDNATEEGRSLNRRVEIRITQAVPGN